MADDDQTQLRQCDFCGRHAPDGEPFGTAESYIMYPDATGSPASGSSGASGPSGMEYVRICVRCAFARTPAVDEPLDTRHGPIDPKYLSACDLCGHVGPHSGGNTGNGYYRLRDLMSWSVSIQGLDGSIAVCRDCTPIAPWKLYRNGGVDYQRESSMDVATRAEAGAGTAPIDERGTAPDQDQVSLTGWTDE